MFCAGEGGTGLKKYIGIYYSDIFNNVYNIYIKKYISIFF